MSAPQPRRAVIIVAGGRGRRMGTERPKQFLDLGGRPVLVRTVERFAAWDSTLQIVVVLPEDQIAVWRELCRACACTARHTVVAGGAERFDSVRAGLAAVAESVQIVGVHDGVRPCVSEAVLTRCYDAAEVSGAAVPVVAVVETLRRVDADGVSRTVPRGAYRLVQTPQVFGSAVLRAAYAVPFSPLFTDDASVVEASGVAVTLVEGNRENVKLTTPFDLAVAEAALRAQ